MSRSGLSTARGSALAALLLAVAACGGRQPADRAAVEYKGTVPEAGSPAALSPQAAAPTAPIGTGGIVRYEGYQAAVARKGDTVASIAGRIGLSASELAAYNGLTPEHQLRAGDELVLPPQPGGYETDASQPAELPQTRLAQTELPTTAAAGPGIEQAPLEASPTAGTGQRSGDWSPDLAAAAIDRWQGFDQEGNLAPPPSSGRPLPPTPEPAPELASPQLDQYQTQPETETPSPAPRPAQTVTTPAEQSVEEAAAAPAEPPVAETPSETQVAVAAPTAARMSLIRPVTGPIVVGFHQGGGRARNDGVDFASPAGSPVVASAAGEVALVSQSLGGLGTIILVRHPGDYLTVYGRVDRVTVTKGDIVSQGQRIGVVASNSTPRMHFEVRKGAESLDPEQFF